MEALKSRRSNNKGAGEGQLKTNRWNTNTEKNES